jgi:hypothetical protein
MRAQHLGEGRTTWLTRPRLVIAAFEGEGAAGLTALVRSRLNAMRSQPRRLSVDLVSEHASAGKLLDDIRELSNGLKIADAVLTLLDRVVPLRRLTLAGSMLAAGDRGAGVVLAVSDGPALESTAELWECSARGPAASASDALRLAGPSAAWIRCTLEADRSGLPTRDAMSYAFAVAGQAWLAEHEHTRARGLLSDALLRDPGNWFARGNLAVAYAQAGRRGAAIHELRQALRDFEKWAS